MSRVLIHFAHPAIHKSRVNRQMAEAARGLADVTFHDLYETYPDFLIDVPREQELLLGHDVVVFQHPFYWYGTPSIMKEWIDLVLEYGFAYGPGGNRLKGKRWLQAITTGGPESAYDEAGHNRFTVRQLLAPIEQTATLCNMTFLEPFVAYETLRLEHHLEIPAIAARYRQTLLALQGAAP